MLLFACFNRTFMELKYGKEDVDEANLTIVLIVPLWN